MNTKGLRPIRIKDGDFELNIWEDRKSLEITFLGHFSTRQTLRIDLDQVRQLAYWLGVALQQMEVKTFDAGVNFELAVGETPPPDPPPDGTRGI